MDTAYTDREVVLVTPSGALASTKNDGTNSSISLSAIATSDIDSLRFQFSTDAGATWTNIGGPLAAPNDDGAYSIEWTPGFALPAAGVLVRANGHSSIDNSQNIDQSAALAVNNTDETSALTPGSALGVYRSPIDVNDDNVIVTGTASAGNTVVSLVDANGANVASTGALAGPNFRGILDIDGVYTYNAPDEVQLRAVNASGTDDGEAYTLYQQVPTTITAVGSPANPADPNQNVQVTVTVLDQNGKPIAGAEVASDHVVDGTFIPRGETNASGQLVFAAEQNANDGSVSWIVNQTNSQVTYDPGVGDIKFDLQVGQGFSADLVGSSNDGPAFDFDEYDLATDIQVQVKDQTGANFDDPGTQDLTYFWKMLPFDPSIEPEDGDSHVVTNDANGLYDVPFAVGSDFPEGNLESGTYELWASLSDGGTGHPVSSRKVLTVKAGEATIEWVDPDGDGKVIAPAGTVATGNGNLVLEDGTGLPGRRVDFHYNTGTEYDEDGNTSMADANIISADPVTTGANGSFSVDVEDIGNSGTPEVGGEAGTGSANAPGIGNWGGVDVHHGFDFVTDQVPNGAVLEIEYDSETAGPAGTRELGTVHLEDAFGDNLAGVQIELSLDTPETAQNGAFFLGAGLSSFLDPVEGNYVPTRDDSLGSTITVSTNNNGDATFRTTIGRDSGFDDDGLTDAVVSADVDGLSADDSVEWDSSNPINASEITIVRTPGQPENQRLDKAVLFDIFAKDQYGNPAKGVEVTAECPDILGDDDTCSVGGVTTPSDLDNGGDLAVFSVDTNGDLIPDGEGEYTFTAEVSGGLTNSTNSGLSTDFTEVYNAAGNPVKKVVETSFDQSWYAGKIGEDEGATYTLTTSPANPVVAGQPVTATLTALDSEGNPLEGLRVDFVRTGDPDTETPVVTDEDGVAQYVFEVEENCTSDTVTAVVRDTVTYDGDPATEGVVSDQSTVVVSEPCKVNVNISGLNSENKKRDIINVTATSDADLTGLSVKLQRKVDGEWKTVGDKGKTLDSDGKARFSVRDLNGNKVTKYRVMIPATDLTKAATSKVLNRR
ncbi:Ig-like domain-containing protein [Nocardioides thalensis]|nr:Ig-like domain-containing protein [Nocardioides thalensis]